jgi:predicted phage terminase large subunit-like protein
MIDKDMLRWFPHSYAKVASRQQWKSYAHLKYLSRQITPGIINGGGRYIVTMPPRHGKSEFISKWVPAWYLDTFPKKNIILTSYGDELASGFGRWVRNHFETNEHTIAKLNPDSAAANRFETTFGGTMITAGVGGSITGRGGHLLICDDPIKNWEEASSTLYRQRIRDWFDTTFYTRQEPGATIILLMTRWHHDDLAGYLINEHNDDWKQISLPGLAEENDPLGRVEGQALCVERYDVEALTKIKEGIPDQHWLSLYQQRPTKQGGEIFKREWWKYYDEIPKNFIHIAQFWDTAQKPGLSNDWTVCATWGKTMSGLYLLDIFRRKLEAPDIEQALIQQFNKWRPHAISIEDKSSGSSVIQYARRSTTLPIIPYDPQQRDKESRAIAATPLVRSGNCYLPRNAPWLSDFLVEHEQFPATAHDDQVDTTSQMAEYFNNLSTFNPRVRSL